MQSESIKNDLQSFLLIFFPRKFRTNQSTIEFLLWFLNWEFDGKSKSFTTINSQQESLFLIIFCISLMSSNLDWWIKSRLQKYVWAKNIMRKMTKKYPQQFDGKWEEQKTDLKSMCWDFQEIILLWDYYQKRSKLLKHSVQTTVFFQASFGTTP